MKNRTMLLIAALLTCVGISSLHAGTRPKNGTNPAMDQVRLAKPMFHAGSAVMHGRKVSVTGAIVPMLRMQLRPGKEPAGNLAASSVHTLVWGNVDGDASNVVDMRDLLYLTSYLYAKGKAPQYMESADLDGNGIIDTDDLSLLLKHLYANGAVKTEVPAIEQKETPGAD